MQTNLLLLLSRLLLAALFVPAGIQTLGDIGSATRYFSGLGLPSPQFAAWGVGLFELIAGFVILAGFRTRITAALLGAFCLVAGYLGHYGQGDDPTLAFLHTQMLMKDIAIAGGFLALAAAGAGGYSIDALKR